MVSFSFTPKFDRILSFCSSSCLNVVGITAYIQIYRNICVCDLCMYICLKLDKWSLNVVLILTMFSVLSKTLFACKLSGMLTLSRSKKLTFPFTDDVLAVDVQHSLQSKPFLLFFFLWIWNWNLFNFQRNWSFSYSNFKQPFSFSIFSGINF